MIRPKFVSIFGFLLFYISSLLQGQGIEDPTANIIPQAPTTASLGSYAYAPVSLATGQQNLSVPIWELSGKTLSLPISLSYRPGVLLEAVSEYTGHGWSLNVGGVITRTIKGNPDPKTRANYTGTPYTYPETWDILTEQKDPSPDIYNYNFNGLSGQFAIKNDGTPYYVKDLRDWQMSVTNAKIEITTEYGIKYIFEDIETTNVEDNYGNYWHNNVTVAWYLSEIISPNGKEKIVFNYYTETIKTGQRLTNNSLKIREDVQATTYIADPSPWSDVIDTKRLSDITLYLDNAAVSKVTFEASTTPRTDLAAGTTAYVLSRINIFPNANSALPAKYFDFNIVTIQARRLFLNSIQEFSGDGTDSKPPYVFTYYNPSSLPSRYSYQSDHWGYYSAHGAQFAALERYSWLTSPSVDTKEPSFPEAQYGSLESVQFPTGGKNKYIYELNEYHKRGEVYQRVNLGLDWQGGNWKNTSGNVSNIETTSFTLPGDERLTIDLCLEFQKSASYSMATLQNEVPGYSITIDNASTGNNVFSADFMYNSEDEDYTDMYVTGKGVCHTSDHFPNIATSVGKCLYQLDLDLNSGTYNVTINTSSTNNSMTSGEASISFKYGTGNQINYKIPGDGIRLARQELRDEHDNVVRTTNYSYVEHDANGNPTDKSSGQITEEPIHGEWITYAKKYHIEPDGGAAMTSSAVLTWAMASPIVTRTGSFSKPNVVNAVLDQEWVVGTRNDFYLKSKEPMAGYSKVSYKEVRVEEVGNGFTLHKFHGLGVNDGYRLYIEQVEQDNNGVGGVGNQVGGGIGYGYPYNANLILHGLWDQPTQTLVYGAGNYEDGTSGPVLLQKTNYDYYTYTQPKLYNTSVSELMQRSVVGVTYLSHDIGYLKSVETRKYENSTPNKYITSTTEYSYGANHLLPIETRKINSDGIIHISKTKYSFDYDCSNVTTSSITGTAIDMMQNRNMIVPIEQTMLIDKGSGSEVIGGIVSKFKYDATSNSIVVEELYSLETATPLSESTNFTVSSINSSGTQFVKDSRYILKATASKYDDFGNIVTYQPTGNIPTTIIWDAQGDLPMGKATNANFNEVFYTSFEEISGGFPKGKTGRKSNIGSYTIDVSNLNTSLSNNNFILSYWKSSDGDNWDFVKQQIYITGNITISPSVANYIDEVRLYPEDAIMSTVVFDSHTRQVTHMADENGHTLEYKYDKLQGLYEVIDFEGNVISRNEYNYAQSGGTGNDVYNFVKTFKFLEAGVNTGGSPTNLDNQLEQIQFIDGIGRPIQSIAIGQAIDGGDIVSHIEYDNFGRADKQFLPFVSNNTTNGAFVANAAHQQETYNLLKYATNNSYAQSLFEASPLNRVVEQGATGNEWQLGTGHTIRNSWRGNTSNEVYDFENNQFYNANELLVTNVIDENGVKSWSFTDKLGRTILTKREAGSMAVGQPPVEQFVYSMTYYLYDDFGRIRKVMPPEAVRILESNGWNENDNALSELIYTYTYDKRGRITEKKIPGAAVQYLMYDELDRVVLTQDGNLRTNTQWLFTEYDILSRPITSGIYSANGETNRSAIQSWINSAGFFETRNNSNTYATQTHKIVFQN